MILDGLGCHFKSSFPFWLQRCHFATTNKFWCEFSLLLKSKTFCVMWSNILVSASNLIALRVIIHLYFTGRQWSLLIFCGSMISSILFHLVETDEIVSTSPVKRPALAGLFNGQRASYGATFLLFDRIFAIAAIVCSLLFLREQSQVRHPRSLRPLWGGVLLYALVALCITFISEFCVFELLYVIFHSLWHFAAFQIAYWIFEADINSPFYLKT